MYPKTFSPLTFLFLFLIPALVFGQERPETIIIPVSSLGEVNETRKQILQNTLEEQLKRYFKLVSQERFLKAQESAFEELDYEDCTEEQCIMLIQEMLQVENAFNLQLIVEGQDTQLSLNWRTLDEKRKATDICRGCDTFELNNRIELLVEKIINDSSVYPFVENEKHNELKEVRSKKEIKSAEKTDEDEENALKKNYFRKFYDERKHLGLIGFSSCTINFERSGTNDSRLVKSLNYSGFNLGYRFYIRGKISLSFSYDGLSLGSVDYYDDDEANEDDESIQIRTSGSLHKFGLWTAYHWYFTRWYLYAGGCIASYFASADYQDKDLKEYQFSDNDTKLIFLIGFDYNFMNNMSMNLEYQSLLGSTKSKEITNSEITHQQELPRFVTFRFGYNFN